MYSDNCFGEFSVRVVELLNHTFSTMYSRVFKKYWNNSIFARMKKPYFVSDASDGYYEVFIPTFEDPEGDNMRFYRAVVKVLPELDRDILKSESIKMRRTRVCGGRGPPGRVDSELIVLIAPRRSEQARRERQFLRARRTQPSIKGFLTAPIINSSPETCVERLLKIVTNFLRKRLRALLKSLRLEHLYDEYYREERLYYSTIVYIIEKLSLSLANAVRCLGHSLNWLHKKLLHLKAEIERQTHIWKSLKAVKIIKRHIGRIEASPKYLRLFNNPPKILLALKPVLRNKRKSKQNMHAEILYVKARRAAS